MAKPKTKKTKTTGSKTKAAAGPRGAVMTPDVFERIADALERLAPPSKAAPDLDGADAFIWHPDGRLMPVPRVNRVEMSLLKGVDRVRDTLVENT
jgi:predicted AAA+ superfamily ATPase